jgi:hypothetical protein
MSTTIDRTAPLAFRELAEIALKVGSIDHVSMGFEGLGADFPAPIGWILNMNRIDQVLLHQTGLSEQGNHMMVSAQVGQEPSAFVGFGQDYLDAEEISQWIHHPRPGIAGPIIMDVDDVELMITALRNGWTAAREITRIGTQVGVAYVFEALNNFYNLEGHPAHRSTGASLSRRVSLVSPVRSHAPEQAYAAFVDGVTSTAEKALAEIAEQAPWYADVAYFDDDQEEWIR